MQRLATQALIRQPGVIVDLGQVFCAGVADKGHDPLRLGLFAAPAQGAGNKGAGGGAGEDPFLQQQFAHRGDGFGVGDRIGPVDQAHVSGIRHEILTDTFNRIAALRAGHAVIDDPGEGRADRISQDDLGLRAHTLQIAGDPGDRAARADTGREGVDVATHLLVYLRPCGLEMRQGVGLVGELVDVEAARNLLRQSLGHVGIVFGMPVRHIRTRQANIGAHRPEMLDFFPGHLVRDHQKHLIALGLADQRQRQTRVAGRRLYDGATGLQKPLRLGRSNHRQGDAVLDRPAGVLRLKLEEQATRARIDLRHLHHRRLADQVQQGAGRTGQDGGGGQGHSQTPEGFCAGS